MTTININDPALSQNLTEAGKWSSRLAIIYFVFIGLFAVMILLSFGTLTAAFATQLGDGGGLPTGIMIFLLLLCAAIIGFYFFLALKLYKFGQVFKASGGQQITNERLDQGFTELGTLFKALVLSVAVFFVLGIGGFVLFGAAMAAML